jgi:choline-sulfatase
MACPRMRIARYLPLLLGTLSNAAQASPPIILISVDTLRADHLSCYNSRAQSTPHLDTIAKGGTLFSQVDAPVPLTLPSHVSLLTSTYPFSNGVEDNGQGVPPNTVTLAGILKAHGYRTAAFVGGFVLDRRFGLDKGFDVYESPFTPSHDGETDASDLKRLGGDVVRSAMSWIEKNSTGPFFVFLHLFDLHTPENLPPALKARFPGSRYEAELAYVDEVVGQFWDFLGGRGLLDKALIVFLSDHGESLGDHGENTHGYFIYQSTLSVPLIIHWPAQQSRAHGRAPERVETPVGLIGVAPTILQAASMPAPSTFQGKSLMEKQREEEIYSESLYGHNHFNTSALFSLRLGNYKYIQAPKPEVYDLVADPGEQHNIYADQQALASECRKRLNAVRARFQSQQKRTSRPPSADVIDRLRSLGYLAGNTSSLNSLESGPDPKDLLSDYATYRRAITLASIGRMRESNTLLESVLAQHPGLQEVRGMLGLNEQRLGENEQAVQAFHQILERNPLNAPAHLNLATSYSRLNQFDNAIKELEAAIATAANSGPALGHVSISAREMLGAIWLQKKEYGKARDQYTDLLRIAPGDYEAHYNLAWLASRDGRLDESVRHLQAAIQSDPQSAVAHNALGSIYLQQKNLDRASAEFKDAIRLDPKLAFAHYNLGLVLGNKGDRDGAAEQFREALKADPQFRAARDALQRLGQN